MKWQEHMNQMFEIYGSQSDKYDELILHEDHAGSLSRFLKGAISWDNRTVREFGAGTGRVTQLYIDDVRSALLSDSSMHMLERARMKLHDYRTKIHYELFDNRNIASIQDEYDIVIEGWSFGHLVVEDGEKRGDTMERLVSAATKMARQAVVIIETLGTNVSEPKAPGDILPIFYDYLSKAGFAKSVIRTDYQFPDYREAMRIMGSFFGSAMADDIGANKRTLVEEYTGVWILQR